MVEKIFIGFYYRGRGGGWRGGGGGGGGGGWCEDCRRSSEDCWFESSVRFSEG